MSINKIRTGKIGNSPISIGRYTYGIENLSIHQWGEGAQLQIGSFCSLAKNINIFLGGNHRADWISTFPFGHIYQNELGGVDITGHPATRGDVIIGHDVWIATGATIMSGVHIGDGAIIGANAHVVKDVAPYHIIGGNPAQSIKPRFNEEIIELLLQLKWWELPIDTIKQIAPTLCQSPTVHTLTELLQRYRSDS